MYEQNICAINKGNKCYVRWPYFFICSHKGYDPCAFFFLLLLLTYLEQHSNTRHQKRIQQSRTSWSYQLALFSGCHPNKTFLFFLSPTQFPPTFLEHKLVLLGHTVLKQNGFENTLMTDFFHCII